jgi:hypothetical protein
VQRPWSAVVLPETVGPRLWAVLLKAGLQPQGMIGVQPRLAPDDPDAAAILSGIVTIPLPLIERAGPTRGPVAQVLRCGTLREGGSRAND